MECRDDWSTTNIQIETAAQLQLQLTLDIFTLAVQNIQKDIKSQKVEQTDCWCVLYLQCKERKIVIFYSRKTPDLEKAASGACGNFGGNFTILRNF